MNPVTGISLSGLNASTLRLQASANNIANVRSNGAGPVAAGQTAYTPLEVQQTSLAGGGVEAALAPSARAALLAYDPSAPFANAQGYVATPDIDLADEMVQLITARYSFAANLQVLRTSDEMQDGVLRILI
ncbi:MAG: flagellar basal body rod C-terminal domain-containing protein [Hyphomonadaceae bacterium]